MNIYIYVALSIKIIIYKYVVMNSVLDFAYFNNGLNIFLISINMSIFCFVPSKKILQLLVPKKHSYSLLVPPLN